MLKKTLHMGNMATAFVAVATAADLSLTGVAGTVISAALSGVALSRKGEPEQKNMAQEMAQKMAKLLESHLAATHLDDDRRNIVTQMLEDFPPSETDLAEGNMQADTIAANMCARIKEANTDPEYKTSIALDDYKTLLCELLTPFLEPASQNDAILHELLRRTDHSGKTDRLREEGITERAIIRLAQRIARETKDLGSAWLTLQDAMDIAVKVQQEARASSNHGDFVDEVLSRVAALSRDGDYARAGDAITDALAENDAACDRLLTSGIDVARLEGNAARAAELLVQQADAQSGGRADGRAIHHLQHGFYERGRDKGIALDLEIAIALGRVCVDRTTNQDDRGAALNNLGNALRTHGEREKRENGIDRIKAAVTAYENALGEFTRDRVPLDWAKTQNNLGTALQALDKRENCTDRLEAAVTAFENALGEFTRDRVPLDWAMTQSNLGAALQALGKRENNTDWLGAAVTAYENALKERTRDRVPLDWAETQVNLAILHRIFFDKTGNPAHLDTATEHALAAREVFEEARTSYYLDMVGTVLAGVEARRG